MAVQCGWLHDTPLSPPRLFDAANRLELALPVVLSSAVPKKRKRWGKEVVQTNRRGWVGGKLGFSWFPTFKKSDRFYTQPRERVGRLDEHKFADAEHAR